MSDFNTISKVLTQNQIQKLQNLEHPLEGNFVETSKSKMGSNIYHIRRDYDLVKLYGFKDLDEQMRLMKLNSLIKITYLGSESIYSGKIRHRAKVEITDTIIPIDSTVNQQFTSEAFDNFMRKLGIKKLG